MTQERQHAPRVGGTGTSVARSRRALRLHEHPAPTAALAQAAYVLPPVERAGDGR